MKHIRQYLAAKAAAALTPTDGVAAPDHTTPRHMPHRKVGSRSTVGSGRPTAAAAATTTTVATAAPQMALDRPSHGHNVVVAIQQPLAIIINKQFNCMIILKAAIGFAHSKIFIYEKQK